MNITCVSSSDKQSPKRRVKHPTRKNQPPNVQHPLPLPPPPVPAAPLPPAPPHMHYAMHAVHTHAHSHGYTWVKSAGFFFLGHLVVPEALDSEQSVKLKLTVAAGGVHESNVACTLHILKSVSIQSCKYGSSVNKGFWKFCLKLWLLMKPSKTYSLMWRKSLKLSGFQDIGHHSYNSGAK